MGSNPSKCTTQFCYEEYLYFVCKIINIFSKVEIVFEKR
jgi:hypothetical protein